jgi:hypothetical protein
MGSDLSGSRLLRLLLGSAKVLATVVMLDDLLSCSVSSCLPKQAKTVAVELTKEFAPPPW